MFDGKYSSGNNKYWKRNPEMLRFVPDYLKLKIGVKLQLKSCRFQ